VLVEELVDVLELVVVPLELVEVDEELELELVDDWHGPHTPSALPTDRMHVSPGQQSALTVHLPQFGTQEPWPW
jgi:hypothetical protein